MSHPTVNPETFGAPCWEIDKPDQFLQSVARVDVADSASFLACHSPITGMKSQDGQKSESEVFDWLFKRSSLETLVIVTGEPGSGKSHFINWLRLRLDDALLRGEKSNIKSVMIKRRSGSLRDALEQLVEQLPDFQHYLDPIRAAIVNLSNETAKRQLCLDLSQLLHQSPLNNRRLKNLHDFFIDPGSLKWLCREGGVIERNIQRLIAQSELEERESLPLLAREDLLIQNPVFRRQSGTSVQELLDVMEGDDQTVEIALSHANSFLRSALERLTGLGNQTLYQVFKKIRQDLKNQGQSLALFIEDVSTLSALDTEVVNVLEPQNDKSLCRLYGVLGMTAQALHRLPENMKGRINLELGVRGSDDNGPLQTEPEHVDRFVARYLNALRLSNENIDRIAVYRRQGSDVRISACDECEVRQKCFEAFGLVNIEDQEIGLFPFRSGAAHRLLHGLRLVGPIKKNPRGLLQFVVAPVLGSIARGVEDAGVNMGLPVEPRPPRDLGSAGGRYLGGWGEKAIQRLSYLLYYWTGFESLNEGAGVLNILREPLQLPQFSQIPVPSLPQRPVQIAVEPNGPGTQLQIPPSSPQYERLIGVLEKWSSNNEPLSQDSKFREVLLPIIKTSVPWYEIRETREPTRSRVASVNTAAVEIEDMVARPAAGSSLRFTLFHRSQDVTQLLQACLRFRYLGSNSWIYPDFIFDRRFVGKWLRTNVKKIQLTPEPTGLEPTDAHRSIIVFLIIAYQFSQRKPLPNDYSDIVEDLLSFSGTVPVVLSTALERIAQDLPMRVDRVRDFLYSEFSVPQGAGGGINFIDPLTIIRTINAYKGEFVFPDIDERFGESYWATRFATVVDLGRSSWKHIEEALKEEKLQITVIFKKITLELNQWNLEKESSLDKLEEFVADCKDVKIALTEARESVGDRLVDNILNRQDNPVAKWKRVLREVEVIVGDDNLIHILHFRTEDLIDLRESLSKLTQWARSLEEIINNKYAEGTGGGDLEMEISNAHQVLDSFSSLTKPNKEVPNVEA